MNILITLLFGAIAGWLAGFFVIKEKGGLIWNIIIGLLGGVVGGWLLGKIGATGSFWSMWYGQTSSARPVPSGPCGMARLSAPSSAPWS